jgi:uncharacterized protein
MTADDLNRPLGQQPSERRHAIRLPISGIIAGVLALFLGVFLVWAFVGNDPLGGEPTAIVPARLPPTGKLAGAAAPQGGAGARAHRYDGPAAGQPSATPGGQEAQGASPTTTVNIINGMTGARHVVDIPAPGGSAAPSTSAPIDQKFVEMTPEGLIPKIAADGVRPADAFAQPVKPLPGKPDAPRIAIIISGLGVSAKDTAAAIDKLPGAVTLAFIPYGSDGAQVAQARRDGHEVLLEVPMEPFNYPQNDTGPQTLLTSLSAQQNLGRLHWVMSRFQGYVGLINMMGARFTASEQSFAPVLGEVAKRGLIYVDDGTDPRSIAGQIAEANNVLFARAEVNIDSVPTPAQIDRALGRLESLARQRRTAVGVATALPASIAHIAKWANSAASRGLLLVPITAAAIKEKQS